MPFNSGSMLARFEQPVTLNIEVSRLLKDAIVSKPFAMLKIIKQTQKKRTKILKDVRT